ncbi:MAG: hypothetical protein AAF493_26435 [Pseudomonadota bacterium]
MTSIARGWVIGFIVAFAAFTTLAYTTYQLNLDLQDASELTGYAMFAVLVFLTLYNVRKRLPGVTLGRTERWAQWHVSVGAFSVALFWLHTGSVWPDGLYERLLAIAFYGVSAAGFVGYALQRILPRRLALSGNDVIFERIPDEIARLRDEAQNLVLRCTEDLKSETLARHYAETLAWYFRRPRFRLGHLFASETATFWINQNFDSVRRYLSESETRYLDQLRAIAIRKSRIDLQYSLQAVLKLWPLVHVPFSVALALLVLWHLLIVNIYAV